MEQVRAFGFLRADEYRVASPGAGNTLASDFCLEDVSHSMELTSVRFHRPVTVDRGREARMHDVCVVAE